MIAKLTGLLDSSVRNGPFDVNGVGYLCFAPPVR